MKKTITAIALSLGMAMSANASLIGKVTTSGWFVKDKIAIHEFQDPTIAGIACHVTFADKSFSFEDPTDSSISCRQTSQTLTSTGPIASKMDIFKKNKSLFFKVMRVSRFYDAKNNTLVYISYTKKTKGENANHSISSVPLWGATIIEQPLPTK